MQRPMVHYLTSSYGLSVRRACRVLPLARSTYKYQSRAPQYTALRQRIRDLALCRVGWGVSTIDHGATTRGMVGGSEVSLSALSGGKSPPTPEKTAAARQPSSSGVTVRAASTQRAVEYGFYERCAREWSSNPSVNNSR